MEKLGPRENAVFKASKAYLVQKETVVRLVRLEHKAPVESVA